MTDPRPTQMSLALRIRLAIWAAAGLGIVSAAIVFYLSGSASPLVTTAAATLVAVVISWPLASWVARRITRPLQTLTEGARAIADGEWGSQVPVEGYGETIALARAFNEMSSRTESAYRAQQGLVSDISHELRTPITSIGGFANAIVDGTLEDEAGIRRAAGIIASESERLSEIMRALLSIADIESGAASIRHEPVDITELEAVLRDRFELAASRRGITLQLALGERGPYADPERLLQVTSTLVDNGLHYARGRVSLTATVRGGRWVLCAENDGPPIPEEDRERVFERFTRLASARGTGGTGLGLAICRTLVELMGGTVTAGSSERLGGALFTVELPLS